MDEPAYTAWLGTLSDVDREFAQKIMARVGALLNSERARHDRTTQRLERRDSELGAQLSEQRTRLDHYEQHQLDHLTDKLIEFADTQVPIEDRKRYIEMIHQATADIAALKAKVFGESEPQSDDREGGDDGNAV